MLDASKFNSMRIIQMKNHCFYIIFMNVLRSIESITLAFASYYKQEFEMFISPAIFGICEEMVDEFFLFLSRISLWKESNLYFSIEFLASTKKYRM